MSEAKLKVNSTDIKIAKLELGSFQTNTYIIICPSSQESLVIDAPAEAGKIKNALTGTNPRYLLLTHAHQDHIGALEDLQKWGLSVLAHPEETDKTFVNHYLKEDEHIKCGKLSLKVLHTPGHTPGSVCYYVNKYLFSGDTIFPGGPGRTQSPENFQQIIHSISQKIFQLPEDTIVFPGHGTETHIKMEKDAFEKFSAKFEKANLYGNVTWTDG